MGNAGAKSKRAKLTPTLLPIVQELQDDLRRTYTDYLLSVSLIDPRDAKTPIVFTKHFPESKQGDPQELPSALTLLIKAIGTFGSSLEFEDYKGIQIIGKENIFLAFPVGDCCYLTFWIEIDIEDAAVTHGMDLTRVYPFIEKISEVITKSELTSKTATTNSK
eukprot:TRINITY_DN4815_c0_g2_i1.p1 TRINITY_DN4815_c0_g2~~TRINITY_DN4815_c0_g2_i1.p1  ORF type:complete len:163 (+),score=45.06 TRINITY_DN4815_c0_g2_i1:78-566(+)